MFPPHPFSTLSTGQPRKGLFRPADLASLWDPTPGCRGSCEVWPTSCSCSVGSYIMPIILPSPFTLIRGVIYLCLSSSSDVDCCLVGIAISFQLILKKFEITCHSSDHFTLAYHKIFCWTGNSDFTLQWMYSKKDVFYTGDGNSSPQIHMCSTAGFLGSCIHTSEQTNSHHITSPRLRDCASFLQEAW